jgi:hypothetical protein
MGRVDLHGEIQPGSHPATHRLRHPFGHVELSLTSVISACASSPANPCGSAQSMPPPPLDRRTEPVREVDHGEVVPLGADELGEDADLLGKGKPVARDAGSPVLDLGVQPDLEPQSLMSGSARSPSAISWAPSRSRPVGTRESVTAASSRTAAIRRVPIEARAADGIIRRRQCWRWPPRQWSPVPGRSRRSPSGPPTCPLNQHGVTRTKTPDLSES